MGKLLGLVSGPLKDIFGEVGKVIDNLNTSGEEKLAAQIKLVEIERAASLRLAELDTEWAKTQAEVIIAEAKSESWLTRSWRPLTMLFLVCLVGVIVWTGGVINGNRLDNNVVMQILTIVQYGLSGYVVGRTAEKVVPDIAESITKVLKK